MAMFYSGGIERRAKNRKIANTRRKKYIAQCKAKGIKPKRIHHREKAWWEL